MAAGATYEPIATQTLGSAASSIIFSSIPATYTDLKVKFVWTPTAAMNLFIRLNNDSTALYSDTHLNGNGSTVVSNRTTASRAWFVNQRINPSTTLPTFNIIDLFSYTNSIFKTALITTSADFNGSGYTQPQASLYRSTSAITQINLVASSDNFAIGTTATLYGIKSA